MKKILTVIVLSVIAALLTMLTAFADESGFAMEGNTVYSAQTPYDKSYVSIDWHTSLSELVGVPIPFGEYVLIPTLNKVNKISEKDGSIVSKVEFDEKVSENQKGVVINNTLIQPTRTSLFAVELESMSIISSKKFGEIVTDIAAIDNYAYFGYKDGEKFKFVCVDSSNNFDPIWEYSTDSKVTSPAKIGGFVVFGAGENIVVKNDEGFRENPVGAEITYVYAGKYAVFMCCENGELRKLRLDENGTTEEGSISCCMLGKNLTAPVGIDNHIYVGSTDGFFAVDGLNMEILKKFDDMLCSSAPIVTIGNGVRAYTAAPHSDANGDRWYLYSILDNDESQTASELAKIIDFTNGKISVSNSGRMFFRDAKGQVWAISENKPNMFVAVLKILILLAIMVFVFLFLKTWAKKRREKRPPEYR